MEPYSKSPGHRRRELTGDGLVLAWVALWAWVGRRTYETLAELAAPGREAQSAGRRLAEQLSGAGDAAEELPLVGDELSEPLREAAGAGVRLEAAGADLVTQVTLVATWAGATVFALAAVPVVAWWVSRRVRQLRRTHEAEQALRSDPYRLALRAVLTRSGAELPEGAARRVLQGDEEVVLLLARQEVERSGGRAA